MVPAVLSETISDTSLQSLLCGLVDIASPTGEEHEIATHIAETLQTFDVSSEVQSLSPRQANAFGVRAGDGSGPGLLVYAPIDTVTSNSAEEDVPWAGAHLREDMKAKAYVKDGHVYGLGAHNPKGHAACILEALRVLREHDIRLKGHLYVGFGAGGMPTFSRPNQPPDTGHGVGCAHMLALSHSRNQPIDAAIIAKSGVPVSWEEVGFLWLEVTVEGKHNYVGSRHLMPYDNAIANAAQLVLKLEEWFDHYAETFAGAYCRPQGTVSYFEFGWRRMPAFNPAAARFVVDLRFGPDQLAADVERLFRSQVSEFADALKIHAHVDVKQIIPATRTAPEAPIIRTAIAVWEQCEEKPHEAFRQMSGATDANILRAHGIPTARFGLAKPEVEDLDFALGMNCVSLAEMRRLTAKLLGCILMYCGQDDHG